VLNPESSEVSMNVMTTNATGNYLLGHANAELNRLISQSRFLGELSEHFFHLAGIGAGMQVLDVGCGAGDVSFLAAHMVGPAGRVVGIDRAPEPVAIASQRAAAAGLSNVTFVAADAANFVADTPVDAIVGRLVTMYWPHPANVLRHLLRSLKPGGIVTFQDYDMSGAKSEPFCPLFETTVERVRQTFARAGVEHRMGLKLGRVFEDAGLHSPHMRLAARVERGADSSAYPQLTEITRTLLPIMERTGVATAASVDIDTLADRLREEAVSLRATLVAPLLVAAWGRR
jgi:SAM-dependent methyltransferase